MMRICIAVPTFQRVEYLGKLLTALSNLTPLGGEFTVGVVVVDNDPDGSARSTVDGTAATFPFALHYEHVASRGLSTVRNHALTYALQHADALVMLDDDELPEPQWLSELLRVAQITGADAVIGPVQALLPEDAPGWIREFRAREYPRFHDGDLVADGWTSNCLVRVQRISDLGLSFDTSLDFAGGEDQLFFRELLARDGTIAYAAQATVWEILPAARRSIGSVLKRSFRRGNSLAMCDRRLQGDAYGLAIRAGKGLAIIAVGAVQLVPLALFRGKAAAVMSSFEIARGAGMLAGLAGVSYQAYRRQA
jgi:glycosyltransferase involved in cell wall biosynthesis